VVSEVPNESESKFGNDRAGAVAGHHYKQAIDYDLKVVSIQWQKDSHGLFDYDMKQIVRTDHLVNKPQVLIRNGSTIVLDALDTDIEAKYGQ